MRFHRLETFAKEIAVLLTVVAAVGATPASRPRVEFTLYQRFLDNGMFQITNHSTKVIELDGMFPFDSGYPFEPAYASLEGYARGRRVEVHTLGAQDVAIYPYPLRPGETIYFQLSFEDDYDLKNCSSAKIRLGKYLSDSFPVRKISATDIDFRQFGTDDESVLFRIQNNGETAILLPAMELKGNADVPFKVGEFEVQKQSGAKWTRGLKVGFGAGNDYRISMPAKETLIFKVPKASFGELLNGNVLRLKVGDFVTRPFRIR